jgi:hypothetical protein
LCCDGFELGPGILESARPGAADVSFSGAIVEDLAFGDGLLFGGRHFVEWFFAGWNVLWLHNLFSRGVPVHKVRPE